MTYIIRSPFHEKILYNVENFIKEENVNKIFLKYKQTFFDATEHCLDKSVLLFDIDFDSLDYIIRYTDKNLYLAFSYIPGCFQEILKSEKIKKIYIFDDLDKLFLSQCNIKNFEINLPKVNIQKNKTTEIICLNNLDDINDINIDCMLKLSNEINLIFLGLKEIKEENNFNKLMRLIYSNVLLSNYPIFEAKEKIAISKYSIYFKNDKYFAMEAFYSAITGSIPFIYSKDRYYKWLPGYLFFDSAEDVIDVIKNKKEDEILFDIKYCVEKHIENLRL